MSSNHLRNQRILLVEDNYFIAADLSQAIYRAGGILNGPHPRITDELLNMRGEDLDAAVLDVMLGSRTSFGLADHLANEGVPFLFSTASEKDVFPERYRAATVLRKPVNVRAMVAALAVMCGVSGELAL